MVEPGFHGMKVSPAFPLKHILISSAFILHSSLPFLRFKVRCGFLLTALLGLGLLSCGKPVAINSRHRAMQEVMESYLGVPYQWGGSTRSGMDCSGLVMRVYQGVGIDLPRTTRDQLSSGERVISNELGFGDILFFKGRSDGKKGEALHTGIFLGEGRFVHASKSRGVIIDSFYKAYWQNLFIEARRIRRYQ